MIKQKKTKAGVKISLTGNRATNYLCSFKTFAKKNAAARKSSVPPRLLPDLR